MKKIAIFCDNLNVGGIQKSLLNLLINYKQEDVSIDLYLFEKQNFFDNKIPKNIKIKYLEKQSFLTKFIYFSLYKKLYSKKYSFSNIKYDVAIDFDSYQNHTALSTIMTNADKKIMWIHNDIEQKKKSEIKYRILHHFFKGKYKYFNKFVGVSKGVIEPFEKVNKIKNFDFMVIPNYIDSNEIVEKSKIKTEFKVDDNVYNIVSVGRLCYQKGFDILINKINELLKVRKDFHLYIIGDGPEKAKLLNLVNENNLEQYVTFLGNQKNPFSYMIQMDGFVLMSRYEGQGMVILEAKVLGLDIFIPKHLEKYLDDVVGYDDVISELAKAKKQDKKIEMLDNYNKQILNSLNKLFH